MTSQQDLFADSEYPDELEDRNTLSQEIEDLHQHESSSDTLSSSLLSGWNKRAAPTKKKATPSTHQPVPLVKKPGRKRQAPTPDEDEDDDEEEASQVIPSALVKGEKLTSQQEEDAMEWYRDHPDLYAKKSPRYMDTSHKTRLFDAQAKRMGIRCKYNIVNFVSYINLQNSSSKKFPFFFFFFSDLRCFNLLKVANSLYLFIKSKYTNGIVCIIYKYNFCFRVIK